MKLFVRSTAIAFVLALPLSQAYAQGATSFDGYLGHWMGGGAIHLKNGRSEAIKSCIGNYTGASSAMQQRVRCAGNDFKIETLSQLQLSGSQIQGSFNIVTFNNEGTITGTMSASGLALRASAAKFNSSINVRLVSKCRQSINITPDNHDDIRSISVVLSRTNCR